MGWAISVSNCWRVMISSAGVAVTDALSVRPVRWTTWLSLI
jgi:hypothetical protein